jgi:hypothetical protein
MVFSLGHRAGWPLAEEVLCLLKNFLTHLTKERLKMLEAGRVTLRRHFVLVTRTRVGSGR